MWRMGDVCGRLLSRKGRGLVALIWKGGYIMEIVVQIHDQYKALKFVEFLRAFDFVEITQMKNADEKNVRNDNMEDFFSCAGLWANREVTAASLREQAWRRYSV
jgi:hypothetical protein